ncbi:MAG: M15 family metallopeptidase [Actinomycetota bacterium]
MLATQRLGTRWWLGRRVFRHPVQRALFVAGRNPRTTAVVGGVGLLTLAMLLLMAAASVQAFLVVSGQSNVMAERRFVLFADDGGSGAGGVGPEGAALVGAAATAAAGAAIAGAGGAQPTEPVTKDETVVVEGIRVHRSIAANLQGLLEAAEADGISLSGWGWRDTNTQIRLRRQHCGTTEYAIYRMPSSQCSPPTARPGSSQHERGLAIDFTYNGGSISTRRNAGFRWLDANAAAFGFKNLASEPWHWSTTGR